MEAAHLRSESGSHVKIASQRCHQLACQLAAPWVYRRNGVYYLRLRPSGTSKQSLTLSLRTKSRDAAMQRTRRIQAVLHKFHLDRPDDTWEVLAVPLRELAEDTLMETIRLEERETLALVYADILEDLGHIGATQPLTADQYKAFRCSTRLVQAAQERLLTGSPNALGDLIVELDEFVSEAPKGQPVEVPQGNPEEMPFSRLSALYLAEQEDKMRPNSLREIRSACKTLGACLLDAEGREVDLKTHTREHMVSLKAKLVEGRKPMTVNKLLTRLSVILTWAVDSGYLKQTYHKGLKISKGAESGRKAFSEEQLATLMGAMGVLPEDSWKRWAMALGVITGARIGEVYQLTKKDIRKVGDTVVVDINDNEGKTLKNTYSRRVVPLIDGALGFDLQAFLRYVEGCEDKLFDRAAHNFTRVLNETLRDVLRVESGEGLTYHSLRHSMASRLKRRGVAVSVAQDILGHSSQTITFDLYGGEQNLDVSLLEAALRDVFSRP